MHYTHLTDVVPHSQEERLKVIHRIGVHQFTVIKPEADPKVVHEDGKASHNGCDTPWPTKLIPRRCKRSEEIRASRNSLKQTCHVCPEVDRPSCLHLWSQFWLGSHFRLPFVAGLQHRCRSCPWLNRRKILGTSIIRVRLGVVPLAYEFCRIFFTSANKPQRRVFDPYVTGPQTPISTVCQIPVCNQMAKGNILLKGVRNLSWFG